MQRLDFKVHVVPRWILFYIVSQFKSHFPFKDEVYFIASSFTTGYLTCEI